MANARFALDDLPNYDGKHLVNSDIAFVLFVIAVAGVLMASNRVRFDIVALLAVLALMLSGVLTVKQSLAGFGSPVVIMVAGLLVVGEMLARTGVATAVGDWVLQRGGESETRLLVLIMVVSAVLGAVMSSTAIVAIFIPIALRIAADTGISASRLLLPMSYAALISGMLTLIATTPNIVVHEELKESGYRGFGFFGFTAIGAAVLAVAIIYTLLIGRRMLSEEAPGESSETTRLSVFDLWRKFNEHDDFARLRIEAGSPLDGQTVEEARLEKRYNVRMAALESERSGTPAVAIPASSTLLNAGDVLVLVGEPDAMAQVLEREKLTEMPRSPKTRKRLLSTLGGGAVLIHPESKLLGKTVREADFHSRYRLQVLGMRRGTKIVPRYSDTKIESGDSLFVQGTWARIRKLAGYSHDFVVLELPGELADVAPARDKMPIAIGILCAMVLATVLNLVPLVAAVLLAVLAAIATRCLSMEDAYRSIHWSSIVLIAGMLPLADALTVTGGTELIVDKLLYFAGEAGPYKMMTILFFLTAALGLVLSNTASAVLVAPIAIYAAQAMGLSPYPFAVAVLIAASAAYSTPVSTPVVTLVVAPGNYSFSTFLKLGIPLLFLTYGVTLLVAPLAFPF